METQETKPVIEGGVVTAYRLGSKKGRKQGFILGVVITAVCSIILDIIDERNE